MTASSFQLPSLPFRTKPFTTGWVWVLCVIGLDYLSSLAYVPSVAFSVAGPLAPLVIAVVVAVTLLLATPLFCYIAGRSPNGHGSIGLLERLMPGWRGKFLVVVILGFVATDLIFTRTFSAADATEHMLHSPVLPWQHTLDELANVTESAKKELPQDVSALAGAQGTARQLVVTVGLLIIGSAFGFVFRKGIDQRLVRIAVVAVGLYLLLTTIIVGCSLKYLFDHPQLVSDWWEGIRAGTWKSKPPASGSLSWFSILLAAALLFPHVALGLSGYELTLASMPLIRGNENENPNCPRSRVRRARWMLVTSALLMSLLLLTSSFIVSILIPADAFETNGQASNRALAYLAHGEQLAHGIASSDVCPISGTTLGAAYDFVTIVVLTLAGVTVLIGTKEIIPPYLHRLGMDTTLSKKFGILMYLFMAVKIGVTVYYRADVDAQRSAYLTGVLALFTGASLTALVDVWKRRAAAGKRKLLRLSPLFTIASIVFAASLIVVAFRHPVAIRMASCFVVVLLGTSMVTRFFRTRELRFDGFEFANPESKAVWEDLTLNHYPMLVPIRDGGESHHEKEVEIRKVHRLPDELAVVFIQAQLGDPSDFEHKPTVAVTKENGRIVVRITNCSSIPHAIAAAALEIAKEGPVPEVHFGWSAENPLTANINFVLFGQGNVPWMVYELIRTAKVPDSRRPRVMVG